MRHSATLPDVFLYCQESIPLSLGVAKALQGLVCASPAQWPRISAAFAPAAFPYTAGKQPGLALLRLLGERPRAQRFNLIGYSFGCGILCSALQALAEDASMLVRLAGCEFNVVLLQPDADSEALAPGQLYGKVQLCIPKLRMLVTAVDGWHPRAMGSLGPTGDLAVPVDERLDVTDTVVPTFTARLGVANLTPLYDSMPARFDINRSPIYELLARFFGQ